MGEYSRRKASGGLVFSRKGSNLVLRDSADNKARNGQICSQIGCGSKLNSEKNTQIGCADKEKSLKQSFFSSANGKEIIGSSSRTSTIMHCPKRASTGTDFKFTATLEIDSDTSCLLDDGEVSEPLPSQGEPQSIGDAKPQDIVSRETAPSESGSSTSVPYSRRHGKRTAQRFGFGNLDSPPTSSISETFRDTNQGTRNASGTSRYNMRNLKCNLVSNVIQSGCSSPSESSLVRKRGVSRKRIGETENIFSARGKKLSGLLLDERRNDNVNHGISISDARQTRNMTLGRDNEVALVQRQRSTARSRLFDQEYTNILPLNEEPLFTPLLPEPNIFLDSDALASEFQFYEASSSHSRNTNRLGRSRENICGRRSSFHHYDIGMARSFMSLDDLRQYNLDGITEVLLALERIQLDEELTYEQLVFLDTNLFLNGLDQHRDMRLDIDNMSYEELLALEERMGSVSTAPSKEAIAKCLKRSSYQATSLDAATTGIEGNDDDVKCSIFQEEFNEGDEVGRLECEHMYHIECIQKWLLLKNWCPICKASATPSPSDS